MTSLRGFLPWIAIGGFLAAFAWFILRPHEPQYQGRPLSFWFQEAFANRGYPSEGTRTRAEDAIRELGPKALPLLADMVGTKRTPVRGMLEGLARNPDFAFLHLPPQEGRFEMGLWGLQLLGPEAGAAVPALTRLLDSDDGWVRVDAALSLGRIGPPAQAAVPALLHALNHPATNGTAGSNTQFRHWALFALGEMGPAAQSALPQIASYTNDLEAEFAMRKIKGEPLQPFIDQLADTSDWKSWSDRAWVVANLGTNGEPAIPLLLNALSSSNIMVQRAAVGVLARIHRQPERCVPALIPFLKSTNTSVRQSSMYGLCSFGAAAKPAEPEVLHCLTDSDQWVRMQATNALRMMDPKTANRLLGPPAN